MDKDSLQILIKVIPIILLIVIFAVALIRHQAARQKQELGIVWLQAMRLLLTHIQRHRGLASGYLSGDKALQAQMEETQKQVSKDFMHIAVVGDWVKSHQGWQSITQHWARLAGSIMTLPVARAIDQHNRLIKNILVFVDDIANAHYLSTSGNLRTNMWRELLTLAELVGQARALGMAVSASGSPPGSKVFEQARLDLLALNVTILATIEKSRYRNAMEPENLQAILNFLSYIDTHLLDKGPLVSGTEFYRVATQTLDWLYERFDFELAKVRKRLTGI